MWPFKKKEDTIESLIKDCTKLYSDFRFSSTLAHHKSYADFKSEMNSNFVQLRAIIGEQDNEDTIKSLLVHYKEQLKFFQKNPFSCEIENLDTFYQKNFPYMEKVNNIISEQQSPKPKMKI